MKNWNIWAKVGVMCGVAAPPIVLTMYMTKTPASLYFYALSGMALLVALVALAWRRLEKLTNALVTAGKDRKLSIKNEQTGRSFQGPSPGMSGGELGMMWVWLILALFLGLYMRNEPINTYGVVLLMTTGITLLVALATWLVDKLFNRLLNAAKQRKQHAAKQRKQHAAKQRKQLTPALVKLALLLLAAAAFIVFIGVIASLFSFSASAVTSFAVWTAVVAVNIVVVLREDRPLRKRGLLPLPELSERTQKDWRLAKLHPALRLLAMLAIASSALALEAALAERRLPDMTITVITGLYFAPACAVCNFLAEASVRWWGRKIEKSSEELKVKNEE